MNTVTIQPEFHIPIPEPVCRVLHLPLGQRMELVQLADRNELLPFHSMKESCGFLGGIDTTLERDADRL